MTKFKAWPAGGRSLFGAWFRDGRGSWLRRPNEKAAGEIYRFGAGLWWAEHSGWVRRQGNQLIWGGAFVVGVAQLKAGLEEEWPEKSTKWGRGL